MSRQTCLWDGYHHAQTANTYARRDEVQCTCGPQHHGRPHRAERKRERRKAHCVAANELKLQAEVAVLIDHCLDAQFRVANGEEHGEYEGVVFVLLRGQE